MMKINKSVVTALLLASALTPIAAHATTFPKPVVSVYSTKGYLPVNKSGDDYVYASISRVPNGDSFTVYANNTLLAFAPARKIKTVLFITPKMHGMVDLTARLISPHNKILSESKVAKFDIIRTK